MKTSDIKRGVQIAIKKFISEKIEKRGNKYVVLSHAGKVLGTHDTHEEALKQLGAVEASKSREAAKEAVERHDAGNPDLDSVDETEYDEDGFRIHSDQYEDDVFE